MQTSFSEEVEALCYFTPLWHQTKVPRRKQKSPAKKLGLELLVEFNGS